MNMKPDNPLEPDVARDATYHRAPDALRDRVNVTLKDMARAERGPAMGRWFLLAASFAAVSMISWNVALMTASSRDGEIEIVLQSQGDCVF